VIRLRVGGDRGSSAAETAIVLPAAYLLILLIVQLSVWAHAGHVARTTAEATLAAARVENTTAADAHTHGTSLLHQLSGNQLLHEAAITVQRDPTRATVEVQGRAPAVIPGLTLPVTVRLSGPVERFTPNPGGFTNPEAPPGPD
jgi:Flp pilus assembly protein TadG